MNRSSAQGLAGIACGVGVALLLWAVLSPAVAAPPPQELAGRCTIEFAGSSTLHRFTGHAPDVRFAIRGVPKTGRWHTEIDVPVADMSTDNRWRDSNMRKMFDAKHYPLIHASFPAIDPAATRPAPGSATGVLPFTLQIREVRRPVTGIVRNWRRGDDVLTFDVEARMSLRDFGLEAPTVMGFIKVHDEVVVTVHATVSARPATIAQAHGRRPPSERGLSRSGRVRRGVATVVASR